MAAILLLNADYRPINAIPLKRAISLMDKEAVEVVETGAGLLRSAYTAQPMPSVLRLRYYVHVPQRNAIWSRRAVFSRDGWQCVYCGKHLVREENRDNSATIDHLVPRETCKKMGIPPSTWTNTVASCPSCNRRKANRSLRDSGMKFHDPKYIAKTPRANYLVVSGDIPAEWRVYLRS